MHKLNDPLRWFVAPVCFVVTIALLTPVGFALVSANERKNGAGLAAALILLGVLGIPASLYLCTALLLSRINALIPAVESLTPPKPAAVQQPQFTSAADEAVVNQPDEPPPPPMPGILYRRNKLRG